MGDYVAYNSPSYSGEPMTEEEILADLEKFKYEGAEKLSPIEYARLVGVAPQVIYYYIRNGVVETETCICGRTVVDVQAATDSIKQRKDRRRKMV